MPAAMPALNPKVRRPSSTIAAAVPAPASSDGTRIAQRASAICALIQASAWKPGGVLSNELIAWMLSAIDGRVTMS